MSNQIIQFLSRRVNLFIIIIFLFFSYTSFIYKFLPANQGPVNKLADSGKQLWQEENCIACHQIYGLGGYLGPDLTNCYSLKGSDYIKSILRTGTRIMPDFKFSVEEVNAIVEYLHEVDNSGEADPRKFVKNKNGTISK